MTLEKLRKHFIGPSKNCVLLETNPVMPQKVTHHSANLNVTVILNDVINENDFFKPLKPKI